jgi:hypothetical protein
MKGSRHAIPWYPSTRAIVCMKWRSLPTEIRRDRISHLFRSHIEEWWKFEECFYSCHEELVVAGHGRSTARYVNISNALGYLVSILGNHFSHLSKPSAVPWICAQQGGHGAHLEVASKLLHSPCGLCLSLSSCISGQAGIGLECSRSTV